MFQRKSRRFRHRSNGRGRSHHDNNAHSRIRPNSFSNDQIRNNFRSSSHSAEKLFEKYSSLAKEAITSGDVTLSENYFQHADHFMRIIEDKNKNRNLNNKTNVIDKPIVEEKDFSNNIDANQKQVSKEQDKK